MIKRLTNLFCYASKSLIHWEGNIMDKTRQLLAYLIEKHPETSITGLMKLAYISDLGSIKKTGNQISNFEYTRYKYGPFDKRIYQCVITVAIKHNHKISAMPIYAANDDHALPYFIAGVIIRMD